MFPTAPFNNHIIDGSFFLHYVSWHENDIVQEIITKYVSFVKNKYANNSVVVFDGCPDTVGTKLVEHTRRTTQNIGREINFDICIKICVDQKTFLNSEKNKKNLLICYA